MVCRLYRGERARERNDTDMKRLAPRASLLILTGCPLASIQQGRPGRRGGRGELRATDSQRAGLVLGRPLVSKVRGRAACGGGLLLKSEGKAGGKTELEDKVTGDGGPLGRPEQDRKTKSDDEFASEIFGVACGEVLAKGKHGGVVFGLQLQVFGQDVQEGAGRLGSFAGEAGT